MQSKVNSRLFGIIIIALLAVAVFEIIITFSLNDSDSIAWTSDSDTTAHTSKRILTFRANAVDKDGNTIHGIDFDASAGTVEIAEDVATWYLPKKSGEYYIVAKTRKGQLKQTVYYEHHDDEKPLRDYSDTKELDPKNDDDKDGLINSKEDEHKTSPYQPDTDSDGLSDGYEVNISKTDPLKADTDSDGLDDGNEIALKMNPLKESTYNDGIKDGNRTLAYKEEFKNKGITVELTGKGNIVSVAAEIVDNSTYSQSSGILNNIYNFSSKGEVESAIITIKYDPAEVKQKGLNEKDLTLYYRNDKGELEKVPTTVNTTNHTITAYLTHFSEYLIAGVDAPSYQLTYGKKIHFLIDNSVSLYSEAQMEAKGYFESKGAVGNDENYHRLKSTAKAIRKLITPNGHRRIPNSYKISEFSGTYKTITTDCPQNWINCFLTDENTYKTNLYSMKDEWKTNPLTGTNIYNALKEAIEDTNNGVVFDEKGQRLMVGEKYIILVTDGVDTGSNGALTSNAAQIAQEAKSKDIKICAIGIHQNTNKSELRTITQGSGCDFYEATTEKEIDDAYEKIISQIDGLYDTDNDNIGDAYLIAGNDFNVTRDGFYIPNYATKYHSAGVCAGLATVADLKYENKLPAKRSQKNFGSSSSTFAPGFNLSGTSILSTNAYDLRFKTKHLMYLLNEGWPHPSSGLPNYTGYMDEFFYDTNLSTNTKKVFTQEYKNELAKIGVEIESTTPSGMELVEKVKYPINTRSEKFLNNANNEDIQLINLMDYYHAVKNSDEIKRLSNSLQIEPDDAMTNITALGKYPIVIRIIYSDITAHSLNFIRLTQSLNDPDSLQMYVYDSNNPGVEKIIYIKRTKQVLKSHWADQMGYYYQATFDGDILDGVWIPTIHADTFAGY